MEERGMQVETIEQLKEFYGGTELQEEEFNKRYKGKPPKEMTEQVLKDIGDFKCGYGLQARAWEELRNYDLPIEDLFCLLRVMSPNIIYEEIKNKLAPLIDKLSDEEISKTDDSDLLRFIKHADTKKEHISNVLLARDDVCIDYLLEVIDVCNNTEIERKFMLKAADSLVAQTKQGGGCIQWDTPKLIEKVSSYFYKKPERQQFVNEVASSFRDIIYKYFEK